MTDTPPTKNEGATNSKRVDHDDGGAAFPTTYATGQVQEGISLLDYFAVRIAPGEDDMKSMRRREYLFMKADPNCLYQEISDIELDTEWRYEKATAMIAEKRRREGANDAE